MRGDHRGDVVGQRRIDHDVLHPGAFETHDLELAGERMKLDRVHVVGGIRGQRLDLARVQVETHQGGGVAVDRGHRVQADAVAGEPDHTGGEGVIGWDRQQHVAVHDHLRRAVFKESSAASRLQILVDQPGGVARVGGEQFQPPVGQVKQIGVVQLRIVAIEAQHDLAGVAPGAADHLCLDVVERCHVAVVARLQIDHVDVPVLVPAGVLQIHQVAVVVRPEVLADGPVAIVGHRLEAVAVDGAHPHVHDAVGRRQVRQSPAVG